MFVEVLLNYSIIKLTKLNTQENTFTKKIA